MSAPIRVSQNGDSDCLTETADDPLSLALDDQAASPLAVAFGAEGPFAAGMSKVEASTLSWLQSNLSTSMSFMISTAFVSTSLISGAASSSAASAVSPAGGACA